MNDLCRESMRTCSLQILLVQDIAYHVPKAGILAPRSESRTGNVVTVRYGIA
jgi:hypothetical protein